MSSPTKITAAFIQPLSEDRRTDRRTDMMKLRYAALNLITQTALQVTAALGNHSSIRQSYNNIIFVTELAE